MDLERQMTSHLELLILLPDRSSNGTRSRAPLRRCTAASRLPDQPRSAVHAHNPA